MYLCTFVSTSMGGCLFMWRPEVRFRCHLPCFLRLVLSLVWSLSNRPNSWPGSSRSLSASASPELRFQMTMLSLHGCWISNAGHHACEADTSLIELSLQSSLSILKGTRDIWELWLEVNCCHYINTVFIMQLHDVTVLEI